MNNQLALSEEHLVAALNAVEDPLTGKGLFTSGRISGLAIGANGKVSFTIEAPAEAAERYVAVRNAADAAVRAVPGVSSVTAVLTAHERPDRPPSPSRKKATNGADAKPGIANVKAIIAVASAKGGVGKSTVAVNLASAFAALGFKTGLLDLDVYGPSAPTLLGVGSQKPEAGPNRTLKPLEAHGLRTMSVGYLVVADAPMIWRGAMATSAVRQMLDDVLWGDLDVLLLDLPPGTGDVQLTLVQRTPLAGAIIVSTPQEMALADVRRGIAMFEKTHAPILGVIENMAYFEDIAGKRTHIFGEGGARRTADQAGVPFLGELPLDIALRESADAGAPLVATQPTHPLTQRFRDLAAAAHANIARLNKPAPSICVV